MQTVLAGDLGGTKCRFALVGADFGVHRVQQVATIRDRAPFLTALRDSVAAILADLPAGCAPPSAAGFGTAGVIPRDGRSIDRAPNLPLDGFGLADFVEREFGLPTTLLNDGRASAWGEFLRGRAAGSDPLLCLFFGTGIGIGLIVDGAPYSGGTNAAGEIGHTTFRPGGRRCPCGGLGHFEAYCGGRAITERAAELLGAPTAGAWTVGALVTLAGSAGDPAAPRAPGPARAPGEPAKPAEPGEPIAPPGARAGAAAAAATDPRVLTARAILAEAEEAACAMVANACTLLNPAAVVVGGGVAAIWPQLAGRLEAHVRAATSVAIHRELRFVPTTGGSDAILWGAAAATGRLFARA